MVLRISYTLNRLSLGRARGVGGGAGGAFDNSCRDFTVDVQVFWHFGAVALRKYKPQCDSESFLIQESNNTPRTNAHNDYRSGTKQRGEYVLYARFGPGLLLEFV